MNASVIQLTGQLWKLHMGSIAYLISTAAVFWGFFKGDLYIVTGALLFGLLGLGFCSLSIRCPKCGAHWYWRALKNLQLGWVKRLVGQPECPVCGFAGKNNDA
jgi:predicted RNA-binding Zn-ribbon protein involved in translation (DUF1610 family)